MRATYCQGEFREIEISGNSAEWLAVADALGQANAELSCEVVEDPSPYSHYGKRITICRVHGAKVRIDVTPDGGLIVLGDFESLRKLARTTENFGRDFRNGDHIHIDYQGGDHHIAHESIPTVFMHAGSADDAPDRLPPEANSRIR
jgi:hypothetical protein